MKRFIIYSSVLVFGLITAAMAEAAEVKISSSNSTEIEAPGADAMTYFASGQHLKRQASTAEQLQNIEPQAGNASETPVRASLQGRADIYVQQGRVAGITENAINYKPCAKKSESSDECAQGPEVEEKQALMNTEEFPTKNLNDQLPAAHETSALQNLTVKTEKVTDVKTGVKTNIIMNTDTGVDISR